MTLKKSELKALVNEVVRQCVKEAGPQYKVRGKKSQLEMPGKVNKAIEIQSNPKINEVAPPGGEDVVKALKKKSGVDNPWAVAWSMKKKGYIQQEADAPELEDEMGGETYGYDEAEEIELLKQMGQIILKLLEKGEDEEPELETPDEEELREYNHKVQHRSHKTVKDLDNNPKNVRDPEIPQA